MKNLDNEIREESEYFECNKLSVMEKYREFKNIKLMKSINNLED